MASPINRTAIYLTVTAFIVFSVFCVTTQAPLLQQDILRRCQDALLMHQIPIEGLSVDGRDVTVKAPADAPILSTRARIILEQVSGVRKVEIKTLPAMPGGQGHEQNAGGLAADSSAQQREVQEQIDRLLQNQEITFKPDSPSLTPESETLLDSVAVSLTHAPALRCEIRGYDDHPQDSRTSGRLALERALSIEDYLVSRGIGEWRLSAHAFQTGQGTARGNNRVIDFLVRAR